MAIRITKQSEGDKIKTGTNGHKIRKYSLIHKGLLGASLIFGGFAIHDAWEIHKFDKYVIKNIEIAANVTTAGESDLSQLSMESSLKVAKDGETNEDGTINGGVKISYHTNPAIIWKTSLTETSVLEELLEKAISRSKEVQSLKESFESGKVKPEYSERVKSMNEKINPSILLKRLNESNDLQSPEGKELVKILSPALEEMTKSEYGQRIAYEYEALNGVIAGGTRTKGKNLSERNKSLLDTLDKAAGWRSIIRLQAQDYKDAHAEVFVGYLMANMGDLDKGIGHFKNAKKIMDKYPDDKNLAIIRDTPELSQKIIKELIHSSIVELDSLNKDPAKYSAGWWKRLVYYNQSIGGQANPSISDVAEEITGRYWARLFWSGSLAVSCFYLAGMSGKKLRLSKKYEVETTD